MQQQERDSLAARVEDLRDMLASKVVPTGHPGASLIPDTEVERRWNTLCFTIRQVMYDHLTIPGVSKRASNSLAALRTLTPDSDDLLRNGNGCIMLAQAVIWYHPLRPQDRAPFVRDHASDVVARHSDWARNGIEAMTWPSCSYQRP